MGCSGGVTGRVGGGGKKSVSEKGDQGSIIAGNISFRNTILNQFSDSWTMYWYLFTLETCWIINLGFFWMRYVSIKKNLKSHG